MNKSFTLIEILVVIVVIGVLSAFILVGMSSISSKANIAKGQAFINSMDNSLLMGRASQWKLDVNDVPAANRTPDTWGTNTGILGDGSTATTFPTLQESGCTSGKCFSFDGGDYVDYGNVLNMTTNDFTISTWLFLTTSDWGGVVIKGASNSGYGFYVTNGVWANCGDVGAWIIPQGSAFKLNTNKWYNVVMSWDRDTFLTAYLDGVSTGTPLNISSKVSVDLTVANSFEIGRGNFGGLLYFKGKIDDVRVYNQVISTSQVEQNYYSGINKLLANNGINLSEFNQRIVELKSNLSENGF